MDIPTLILRATPAVVCLVNAPVNIGQLVLRCTPQVTCTRVGMPVPISALVLTAIPLLVCSPLEGISSSAGVAMAALDINAMFRGNCMENLSDTKKEQIVYIINAGLQQFYASQRIHEFVTNMRLQEYPPEFTDCIAAGGTIHFKAANGYTGQQADVIRSSTHKYKCIADHDYDTTAPTYSNPGAADALWSLINEKDLDVFVKGYPLPDSFPQQAGLPHDRAVQHVAGVVYANQTSNRQNTHILRPVGTTERGALKLQDLNVRVGVIGDWFDDTQPAVALTTGNYTGSNGSPTLTVVSGGPAAGTIPKGTYVSRTDASFTGIAQGVRVLSHDPVTGVITLDANLTAALTNVSLTFTYDRPPLYYEVFRDQTALGVPYPALPVTVVCSGTSGAFSVQPAVATFVANGSTIEVAGGYFSGTATVLATDPGGAYVLDKALLINAVAVSMKFHMPQRILTGRKMIRCFTSQGLDLNSSVFVHWCPTPVKLLWEDVEKNTAFDVALPYLELYLFPIFRFLALQSGYFPPDDYATRAPRIVDRYNEVMGLLGLADFQQPALAKPEPVSTPAK